MEDFVLYTPSTNIEANEIAILKVKDTNKIDDIKDKISTRVENKLQILKIIYQMNTFNRKTCIKDKRQLYFIYYIGRCETIEDIFDESFK